MLHFSSIGAVVNLCCVPLISKYLCALLVSIAHVYSHRSPSPPHDRSSVGLAAYLPPQNHSSRKRVSFPTATSTVGLSNLCGCNRHRRCTPPSGAIPLKPLHPSDSASHNGRRVHPHRNGTLGLADHHTSALREIRSFQTSRYATGNFDF